MDIIDTPFNTKSKISCLVSQGVGTVIRYYNFSNSLSFPEKCLQLPEAQALGAQGLRTAVVFQQRQNQVADFSETKGAAAGRRAYRHAHDNIGQPAGSAIYFSVDFDATKTQITNNVVPFFEGIKRAFEEESDDAPEYGVGAYGSGLVCSTLAKKKLIDFRWLAMSRGFSGTREAPAINSTSSAVCHSVRSSSCCRSVTAGRAWISKATAGSMVSRRPVSWSVSEAPPLAVVITGPVDRSAA